jgi:hypothetical protein
MHKDTHRREAVRLRWDKMMLMQSAFAKFTVDSADMSECDSSRGNEFSCLSADFTLRRQLGYYMIRVYGPSILIVLMTFAGFWMPIQWLPARTNVLVLPLLTLVTQQNTVNSEIAVSYIVALHAWYTMCIFFIFAALVELAIALLYAQRVTEWKEQEEKEKQLEAEAEKLDAEIEARVREYHHQTSISNKCKNMSNSSMSNMDGDMMKLDPHLLLKRQSKSHFNFNNKRDSLISMGDTRMTRSSSHLIKLMLTHVYGHVDWRKCPRERNKIDYVSRILFPLSFTIFVTAYFMYLEI